MINKVIIQGRLTADPELTQTTSGISLCRISIAVDRGYKSKETGESQTDFINVIAWRHTAEFISRYFKKGSMIIVEGNLKNNNYTDSDGVKHYSMNVHAESVHFAGGKSENRQEDTSAKASADVSSKQPKAAETVQLENLDDFEEIISDGEVQF